MKTHRIVLCVIAFVLCLTFSVSAEIFRWHNADGDTHYSTNPPSQGFVGKIEVKRNGRWQPYTGKGAVDPVPSSEKSPTTYTTSSSNPSDLPTTVSKEIIVPYNKQSAMIMVDVTINRQLTRQFIVDTGATYTAISQEIADALHIRPNPNIEPIIVQTANGRVEVPLINLNSIEVGGVTVPNITAGIHQFEANSISGLLGLNFLNHFQMTVDANKNQLILKPIESLTQYQNRDCVAAREHVQHGRHLNDGSELEATYYRKALDRCPDLLEAHYLLGAVYLRQKEAQKAIDIHRNIVNMQPRDAEAHFRLGLSYMLAHQSSQARQSFQNALQHDPNHAQAQEYLTYINTSP